MPSGSVLSQCPAAIIIAKEKRQAWASEEAWDLAVVAGGRVVQTRYPGVIVVVGAEPARLVAALRNLRMSFISRINPRKTCVGVGDEAGLRSAVTAALEEADTGSVDLRLYLRGASKKQLDHNEIKKMFYENNIVISRRSRYAVFVDGIDDVIVLGWGRKRSCGYSCTYAW